MNYLRQVLCLVFLFSALGASARFGRTNRIRHSMDFFSNNNTLRIESYLGFQANNGLMTTSYPNMLIRYGLIDILELRLNVQVSSVNDRARWTTQTGLTPLQPGLKLQLCKAKKLRPAVAFTSSITIPHAATDGMRQTYWAPLFVFSAEQNITQRLSFEYALGMQWDADNFQRGYLTSLNMEYDFSTTSTVYADAYLLQPESGSQTDMRLDVGVNRQLTKHLQLDLSMGAGLTPAAPEFFFNAGFIFAYGDWKRMAMHKGNYQKHQTAHGAGSLR
ncbi:MAG: transporter [Bacteroidetes bacterium]|nr:transporter [Bacteroidota bacterium]